MKPPIFVHGGQAPILYGANAQQAMPGVAVTPTAKQLAAALRGGQPAATPPAPATPAVLDQTMFHTKPLGIGDGLIKDGMDRSNPVGSNAEGFGRLAQIIGGNYYNAQDRDGEGKRHRNVAAQIEKHLGAEAGQLYAVSDEDGRKALAGQTRDHLARMSNEARELKKTQEGAALLNGVNTARGVEDALLSSNNPAFIQKGVEARLKRLEAEAGPQTRVEYKDGSIIRSDKRTGEIISVEEPRLPNAGAQRPAVAGAGAPSSGAGQDGRPSPDATAEDPKARLAPTHADHVDSWESATTPSRQKEMFGEAMKTHHETAKLVRENATAAARGLAALQNVEAALDRGAYTGSGAEYVLAFKKVGAALGMEFAKGASDMEIVQATANELAKSARAGYPGSVSNFEMQTYLKSVVSLGNTPEGNRQILDFSRRLLQRQLDVRNLGQEYINARKKAGREGILAEGFQSFVAARAEASPIFSPAEVERMSQAGGGLDVATSGKQGAPQMSRADQSATDALKNEPNGVYEIGGRTVHWKNGAIVGGK